MLLLLDSDTDSACLLKAGPSSISFNLRETLRVPVWGVAKKRVAEKFCNPTSQCHLQFLTEELSAKTNNSKVRVS